MESKLLRSLWFLGGLMLAPMVGLQAITLNLGNFKNTYLGSDYSGRPYSFIATNGQQDSITFDERIDIAGYVVVGAYAGGELTVDIGSMLDGGTNATVFRTGLNLEGGAPSNRANLIFFAENGGEVTVNVESNCYFTGGLYSTDQSNFGNSISSYEYWNSADFNVTFSGSGQINIILANGVTFAFDSLFVVNGGSIVTTGSSYERNPGNVYRTYGTDAYIVMDQTEEQAIENRENKVIFSRKDFMDGAGTDDVTVRIGIRSTLTFISNDWEGLDNDVNGAIAFDVSNDSYGRFKLEIAGGSYDRYRDGAFLIYGVGLDDDTDSPLGYVYDTYKTYFSGNKAIVRLIDAQSQGNNPDYLDHLIIDSDNQYPYYGEDTSDLSRRGLLIDNRCNTTNPFAANPFGDFGFRWGDSPFNWNDSIARQVGFVVGVNGVMEADHNTFYDYLANSLPTLYDPYEMGLFDLYYYIATASDFKLRSPAALLCDGLDFTEGIISNGFANGATRATINLYGQSALYVRSGVQSGGGVNSNYWVGAGYFDGDVVLSSNQISNPDGVMVLDFEGETIIRAIQDETNDPYNVARGYLNMPSITIDYAGREVSDGDYVSRPLNLDWYYDTYQRSFFNANNDVHFVNSTLRHTDALHRVVADPIDAEPTITGGEAAYILDQMDTMPFFFLSNARVECHESLCSTGLRWIVRDTFAPFEDSFPEGTHNSSSIVCYNHGHIRDQYLRDYGRVFALGSDLNLTYDFSTSPFMDSAYLNLFRDEDSSFNDEQFPPAPAQCVLDIAAEQAYLWNSETVNPIEQATQVVMLGNDANITIGWPNEYGFYRFQNAYPWNDFGGDSFTNDAYTEQPAELLIRGNNYYFFGKNRDEEPAPVTVTGSEEPGVLYVNRGGLLTLEHTTAPQPENKFPHAFFDVPVGVLLWPLQWEQLLYGQTDLPEDQNKFGLGYGIQPYNVDLGYFDPTNLDITQMSEQHLTEVSISWSDIAQSGDFVPVKSPKGFAPGTRNLVRSTVPVTSPVVMPGPLMTAGAGYYADQFQISGATSASPFYFYFSGDNTGYSQVREIVSVPSFPLPIFGEGMFGALFLDQGARLGLGSRAWNAESPSAWNMLGENWVTLYPNGDCVIDLNSDIIVRDLVAIVPTTNFGDVPTGYAHRITFMSQDTKEIRIPAGGELDLSAFGQADHFNGGDGVNAQQIAFGGKVRLVFEPGSTLRFPSDINFEEAPILYMNEDSEIVFETIKERNKPVPTTLAELDRYRVKIKGIGKIWLNKNAKMIIADEAMVGIESESFENEDRTPFTFIQMSIQREGQFLIGDENTKGGSFQVGNPVDQGESFVGFQLRIAGQGALVNIDRFGFFGLGAGILSQADDPVNSWNLVALNNHFFSEIRLIDGTFSHNQIYDGGYVEGADAGGNGSLMAIGPAFEYVMEIGPETGDRMPIIRGGGNLVYVTFDATENYPLVLSDFPILNAPIPLVGDEFDDDGQYTILGSTPMTRQKLSVDAPGFASIATIDSFSDDPDLIGGMQCEADQAGFFEYLGALSTRVQTPRVYASFGINNGQRRLGCILGDPATSTIQRTPLLSLLSETDVERADQFGFMYVTNRDSNDDATGFKATRQQ